jgi:hypothetical protein
MLTPQPSAVADPSTMQTPQPPAVADPARVLSGTFFDEPAAIHERRWLP